MLLGTTHQLSLNNELSLFLEEQKLEIVNEYLYLGILMDSNLWMNLHVDTLYKALYKLSLISKTRHLFD